MALQRTFSGFPSWWPGYALLLLRCVVGGSATLQAVLLVATTHGAVMGSTVGAALVLLAGLGGLALIIGFMTPIVSLLLGAA